MYQSDSSRVSGVSGAGIVNTDGDIPVNKDARQAARNTGLSVSQVCSDMRTFPTKFVNKPAVMCCM